MLFNVILTNHSNPVFKNSESADTCMLELWEFYHLTIATLTFMST